MEEIIKRIKSAQDLLNELITELLTKDKDIQIDLHSRITGGSCFLHSDNNNEHLTVYIRKWLYPHQDTL